jgi:hypothetical protein
MRTLIVSEFISLDGVIQAPGGADEDRDGGFGINILYVVLPMITARVRWHIVQNPSPYFMPPFRDAWQSHDIGGAHGTFTRCLLRVPSCE